LDSRLFYDELSSMYDVMFPYASQTMRVDFLDRIFTERGIKTVLDCGCGTGRQVIDLSLRGFRVSGSDISPNMLDLARQNAAVNGLNLEWIESDFGSIKKRVAHKFGGVYCIGNSLPHVGDRAALKKALGAMVEVLEDGGVLVLHLLNYEHLLTEKLRLMPTLTGYHRGTRYIFQRILDFLPGGLLNFSILTLRESEQDKYDPSLITTLQYPATRNELDELLVSLGMIHVTFYGGFDQSEYSIHGDNLVLTARKPPVDRQLSPVII